MSWCRSVLGQSVRFHLIARWLVEPSAAVAIVNVNIVKSTWNEVKKYSFSRTAYLNVSRKCRLKRVCSVAQKMAIVGERRRDTAKEAKDAKRQAKDVKSQWKRGKATRNYEVGGNTAQEYTATPLPRIFAKTNRFRNSFLLFFKQFYSVNDFLFVCVIQPSSCQITMIDWLKTAKSVNRKRHADMHACRRTEAYTKRNLNTMIRRVFVQI